MQIGRFFSLGQGRVGQYLSPRVLMVRSPFRRQMTGETSQFCCVGFDNLQQAQRFLRALSRLGFSVELRQSQLLKSLSYEIVIGDRPDLARRLANWERHTASQRNRLMVSPQTEPAAA